jgi:hypothetical protein
MKAPFSRYEATLITKISRKIAIGAVLSACAMATAAAEPVADFARVVKSVAPAELKHDKNGDPRIQYLGPAPAWEVLFINCTADKCESASFFATVDAPNLTLEDIDRLNRSIRYLRVSRDEAGAIAVQMDVFIATGLPDEAVRFLTNRWVEGLKRLHAIGTGRK